MGPQLYRCGNLWAAHWELPSVGRFNGAATLSLRKYILPSHYVYGGTQLQWGRNFIVAEICFIVR